MAEAEIAALLARHGLSWDDLLAVLIAAIDKSKSNSFGSASTVKATAERLAVSIPTVYALIREGELESFKVKKYRKVLDRSTDALIARRLSKVVNGRNRRCETGRAAFRQDYDYHHLAMVNPARLTQGG